MIYIKCIGEDEKIHTCEVDKTVTKCGKKIKSKKVRERDYDLRFSCGDCSY